MTTCRLCLSEDATRDIFNDGDTCSMVMAAAQILLRPGDGLPSEMCDACFTQVTASYSFQLKCKSSDTTLRRRREEVTAMVNTSVLVKTEALEIVEDPTLNDTFDPLNLESDDMPEAEACIPSPEYPSNAQSPTTCVQSIAPNADQGNPGDVCHGNPDNGICQEESDEVIPPVQIFVEDGPSHDKPVDNELAQDEDKPSDDVCQEDTRLGNTSDDEDEPSYHETPSEKELGNFLEVDVDAVPSEAASAPTGKRKRDPAKPHHCPTCFKTFLNTGNLTKHVRTHSEAGKIYRCQLCDRGFTQSNALTHHMSVHTGARPFTCPHCPKAYSRASILKTHLKSHEATPSGKHFCQICKKSVTTPAAHARKHTGERPYGCSVCGRTFALSGTLTVHMRRHDNVFPFGCLVPGCGSSFRQPSNLQQHMRSHAKVVERSAELDEERVELREVLVFVEEEKRAQAELEERGEEVEKRGQ